MSKRINLNVSAAVFGGAALGVLTAAGNPWTVPDALADDLVNRNLATYADAPPTPVILTPNALATIAALVSGGGSSVTARANTIAVIGDSISCFLFQRITATSIVRASNVLTISAASHGIPTGARVAAYGVTNDETMNVSWAQATRVDANTVTVPSVGAAGTGALSTARLVNLQNWSAEGFVPWALALSNARARLVYAGVRGGATIDQITASGYVTACIAENPGACVVMLGINNATGADSAATIISKLWAQIFQPLIAAGIKVYAVSLLPVGSGLSSFAAVTAKVMQVNEGIRRLCASTPALVWVNAFKALADPTAASAGAATSGMLNGTDNLHPQDKGAYAAGSVLAAAITATMLPLDDLVSSNGDNYGTNSGNANLLDVGLMAGTGGTVTAPVTGTAPNTWKADSVNPTSAVASIQSRADGIGSDFQMVFTPAGSNSQAILQTLSAALNGRIAGGRYYELLMEVSASGVSASGCTNISAYLSVTVDGVSYNVGHVNGYTGDSSVPTADLSAVVFRSLPIWIPAGTITSPQINVIARFAGASASALTLKIGRASFKDLS